MNTKYLKQEFGIHGIMLWEFANGLDQSQVSEVNSFPTIKSIGNITTLPYNVSKEDDVRITLYVLCESVAERLGDNGFLANTVQIWLRDKNLYSCERQGELLFPTFRPQDKFQTPSRIFMDLRLPRALFQSLRTKQCHIGAWQNRPLSEVYSVLFIDALHYCVWDNGMI